MDMQTGDTDKHILDVLVEREIIPARAGWRLHPASGGFNSRVYFARRGPEPPELTLRLAGTAPLLLRREAEILTSLSGRSTCAPAFIALIEDVRLDGGLMLAHRYVTGDTAPLSEVAAAGLRSLGACLAQVHDNQQPYYEIWPWLNPARGTRAQGFGERVEAMTRYTTFTGRLHDMVAPLYRELRSLPLPGNTGWNASTFALLHGDLSSGNIIWDGDAVTLIDWEYARYGDPAEDLAYVLAEQPLTPEAIATLHESYVNAGGEPAAIERASHYAPLASLDSALWWGDYHLSRGTNPAAEPEVTMHLTRAVKALRNHR